MEPKINLEHSDARGEIYSISLPGNKELMLLFSKAGVFRGGHSHDCDEIVVLLSGKMRYHKRTDSHDVTYEILAGSATYNPAGQIHMGEFLEDSWVVEWKLAKDKDSWSQQDYGPYRERVRASNKT